MTVALAPAPIFQGFGPLGFPLVGGQLFTYIAGTTTPQATYVDSTQTTPNTNPVILNSLGQANVWLNTAQSYKFVLEDVFGNLLWSVDNIPGGAFFSPIGVNLIPAITNTFNIGSPTFTWANGYFGTQVYAQGFPLLQLQTAAELAAGVTPVNLQYQQGIVDRYGTNTTPGTTDMTTAINNAIAAASRGGASNFGNAVTFLSGTYAFSSDITMPMGDPNLTGGGIYAVTIQGQGKEQTILKAVSGSFTHGLYYNGGSNYKNMGTLRDLQIDGSGLLVDAITMSFAQMGKIDNVNVRHCIGRGLYVNNCLMSRASNMFVTTCSSNGSSQIEIDGTLTGSTGGTTTFILDHCWSQGGAVGCTAALAIDRSNNVSIINGAYESSGFCFVISGKTASFGCFGVVFDNVDFESPGASAYFAAGFGLSGGVLTNFGLRNCTGEGPGAISYVCIMQQTSGFFVEGAGTDFILGGSQAVVWNLFGTTNINARIDACPLMVNASSTVPWVDVNGAQIRSAGPLVRWEQGTQVAPYFFGQKAVSGATWSVWVDGANVNQGSYYRTLVASNVGATGINGLPGDAGMEINIIGDGFSTLPQGVAGNNFDTVAGANLLLLANHYYQFRYDGSRGCWRQLGIA